MDRLTLRMLRDRAFRLAAALLLAGAIAACSEDGTGPDPNPDPDPDISGDTIQLDPGVVVGREVFPRGNTDQGGQGEVVAGVGCIDFTVTYHVHAHVSLFVDGEQLALPAAVGITDFVMNEQDTYVASGACFYWLHLHDASGVIHIEPPSERALTLGQLFAIWGRPLTRENVAGYEGPVTVHVDGVEYTGELADIVFAPYREITLQVGEPLDTLPAYRFNPGY